MENVGDILSPRSIWLGECFIWTGRHSGKAWCYDLLKVPCEGNYNMVGNGTYIQYVPVPVTVCRLVCMWLLCLEKEDKNKYSHMTVCLDHTHFLVHTAALYHEQDKAGTVASMKIYGSEAGK